MSIITLYGTTNGYSSRAQVTRGFEQAIRSVGVPYTLRAVDRDNGEFDRPEDTSPIAIMTGRLEASGMVSMVHRRRFAMVAPNSTAIPRAMKAMLKDVYTDIIVPSEWCRNAVSDIGLPVHVVPHGVFEEVSQANRPRGHLQPAYDRGMFSVVHFSSSHGQRKGTIELVTAWQKLLQAEPHTWSCAYLVLVLDYLAQVRFMQEYQGEMHRVTITPRLDGPYQGSGFDPLSFADGLRIFHAVCQPSRGEAFGLIPLEAMAAGVPSIFTLCSGHTQYGGSNVSGNCLIYTNQDGPIDDCDGAMAPIVSVESICDGLQYMRRFWREKEILAERNRQTVLTDWSWNKQVGKFIKEIT